MKGAPDILPYACILCLVLAIYVDVSWGHSCQKSASSARSCEDSTGECNSLGGYCITRHVGFTERQIEDGQFDCCCTATMDIDCPYFTSFEALRYNRDYRKPFKKPGPFPDYSKYQHLYQPNEPFLQTLLEEMAKGEESKQMKEHAERMKEKKLEEEKQFLKAYNELSEKYGKDFNRPKDEL